MASTHATARLAQLVESCRPVLTQLPLGCAIADPEFRAVFWNTACERIFGFTEAEILGKTPYETVVPRAEVGAIQRVHGSVAGASARTHSDNVNVTKDGRVLRCRWHNAPLHSPDGELIGIVAIVLDFTERDLELEAIRQRETQVRNALQAAPEAILTLDRKGYVQTSNLEAGRLFGYAASDLCGVNIGQLLPCEGWFRGGLFDPPSGPEEITGLRSDGSSFLARVSVGSADLPNHTVFTSVIQDLTQQRAAERKLQEQQRMESLGRLAGGVAHDFNNLLTAIVGASSMMSSGSDARMRGLRDTVLQACERASALTAQLLAFSKQQVGSPRPLELNGVVRNALNLLERVVGERWCIVTEYVTSPCVVQVDRGQLEQVLMNLVINARDAMPEGGSIRIETYRVRKPGRLSPGQQQSDREYIGLAVTDAGEGIDPAVEAHIFEPFFTTKPADKGTGLGLATVYGIVQQAGGHVRVESRRGKGARFEVLLPAARAELEPVERTHTLCEIASFAGRSVLLVEDDEQVRATTAQMLRELGFSVAMTASGEEALEVVARSAIDVLVTDLVMPCMDGRTLAERIRQTRPELPVVFITGYTPDAAFHRGGAPQRSQLLQKPYTFEAVARALSLVMTAKERGGVD